MEICPRNECTACYGCVNICPRHCISMKEDEFGFIYPVIDEEQCIHCGMCQKVCLNHREIHYRQPQKVFAAWNKKDEERELSSSGGVATLLANWVLEQGGVVFGATWSPREGVCHSIATSPKDLGKFRGSKYNHSYVRDTFQQCKRYLLRGKTVLFTGTPCQIEGLKGFLGKEYESLYTMDLICHGVPSHKMLADHLAAVLPKNESANSLFFRKNNEFALRLESEAHIHYNIPAYRDTYMKAFLDTQILRENCYRCKFARTERVGDITVGDFWGLKSDLPADAISRGISCVLINTEKGLDLWERVKNQMEFLARSLEEAARENGQLNHPSVKTEKHDLIFAGLGKGLSFDAAVSEAYKKEFRKIWMKDKIKGIDEVIHIPVIATVLKVKKKYHGGGTAK